MTRPLTKEGLMKWVDDQQQLDPRETLILTKLAAYADAEFCSWSAIKTLAYQGRSSTRKVQYALREFERQGLIRDTGRTHRLKESTREVPVYEFAGFLEETRAAETMGANGAPIEADGCTEDEGMGAQGVRPHKEPIEQTTSDEVGERAREAVFDRLERAFPKLGLGATFRDRAKVELWALLDEGIDPDELIQAARNYDGDKAWKRKDLGLQHWLHDRRFRTWWPEAQLALGTVLPVAAGGCDDGASAAWIGAMAELQTKLGTPTFGTWLGRASLGQIGEDLFLVAATGMAFDWLKANRAADIAAAWRARDARPLTLISKSGFEALLRRGEGVS